MTWQKLLTCRKRKRRFCITVKAEGQYTREIRSGCLILSSFCDPNRLLAPRNFRVLYAAQQFSTVVAEAVIGDRFGAKTRRYLDRLYLEILATREGLSASLDMVDTIERSGL